MNSQPEQSTGSSSTLLEGAELALEKLCLKEVELVKETEELFKKQVDHIRLIDQLKEFTPSMEKVETEVKSLSSLVDSSYTLVEDVCSKVRRIDLAKVRLEECISRVSDILDLRTCRDGMSNAMEAKNYEEAAINIKRFLSINQTELRSTVSVIFGHQWCDAKQLEINELLVSIGANVDGSNKNDAIIDPVFIDAALKELDEARDRLLLLCQQNITRAIKDDDIKDIERFFKIFPMLNEHQDGLLRYAEYLKTKVVMPDLDPEQKLKSVQESNRFNQADKLAALYESIAKIIDLHRPLVETYYGPGYLIVIVKVIQKECDKLSRKILEEFRDASKLQSVSKIVRSTSLQSYSQASVLMAKNSALNSIPPQIDPREVDNILNEVFRIISRSEVYLEFIVQHMKEDLKSKSDNYSEHQSSLIELYNFLSIECELNHLIQELGDIYVMLEQFYLNESSKKAILIDQIVKSSSYFLSSMLDDIFFIITKCTKRAIATKSVEVFCAIINQCVTLLESTFCQTLDDRIKNQQYYSNSFTAKNLDLSQAYSAIRSGRYLQTTSEQEITKAQYFSALNNLDKACDSIQDLRAILDNDIKKLKPSLLVQQNNSIEKSLTCLNDLLQLVSRFSSIVNSSLYQLFNASLRSRLKLELKNIVNDNPNLTSELANNPDKLTRLAESMLLSLDRTLVDNLTPENYSKLASITKDFLVSTLKVLK